MTIEKATVTTIIKNQRLWLTVVASIIVGAKSPRKEEKGFQKNILTELEPSG
jgi:hypothetical protein